MKVLGQDLARLNESRPRPGTSKKSKKIAEKIRQKIGPKTSKIAEKSVRNGQKNAKSRFKTSKIAEERQKWPKSHE